MASAIKIQHPNQEKIESLSKAFEKLDSASIKRLARIIGNYYRPNNRNFF